MEHAPAVLQAMTGRFGACACNPQVGPLSLRDSRAPIRLNKVQVLQVCPQLSIEPGLVRFTKQGCSCGINIGLQTSDRFSLRV